MPLEFAKGDTSFNPQPTARNLNKPAPLLRVGQNGEGDTQDFAIVLAACSWVLDSVEWIDGVVVCPMALCPNGAQGDSPGQSEAPPWDSVRNKSR